LNGLATPVVCDASSGTGADGKADGKVVITAAADQYHAVFSNVGSGTAPPDSIDVTIVDGTVATRTVVVRQIASLRIDTVRASDGRALAGACYAIDMPSGYAAVAGCAQGKTITLPVVRGTVTITQTSAPTGYAVATPQTVTITTATARTTFANSA